MHFQMANLQEVYVKKEPSFENPNLLNHAFILNKALYGLKQALGARYDKFSSRLLEDNFQRVKLIKHFLFKLKVKIFLFFKYMLMISCLELITILYVRNFLRLCAKYLK